MEPGDTLSGSFLVRSALPGGSSASEYTPSNGIFFTARPKGECTHAKVEKLPWYLYPARWRLSLTEQIQGLFPQDVAGFARALVLGDTEGIDYATDTAFKRSGIRHVIAVSGLHVSILFSLVYFFTGRRKWLTALLGFPALLLFAALAGFSPSITRACIMHGLTILAMLVDREYDPPSALSFAVLVMLFANPWTVTHVGFQLSVGCVVGIFLFATPIQNWLLDKKRLGRFKGYRRRMAKWLSVSVSISIGASILTTALSAYYFGMVSLVSVLTNLLTLWVITFIFYGILLALALSWIFSPLGVAAAWVTAWPVRYVLLVAKTVSAFPLAAVYTESVYIVLWLIFCYILLFVFLLQKQKQPLVLCCCAAVTLCTALLFSWEEPRKDDFRMTMLDVGQGQCILLQSDGRNYLVDCGGDSASDAADKAVALLESQGIFKLDGLILTHYDRDHAAGAELLLQRMEVDVLFLPNCRDEYGRGETLAKSHSGTVLYVDRDIVLTFSNTEITLVPSQKAETDNESGLCVLFQRLGCDILITADRSDAGERELLDHMPLPDLEVLVVGHHGSKHSTGRELLIKTAPDIAFVSVGLDNPFGHPSEEVLQRLAAYGIPVYRTDLHGTIIYRG
jgi:competence protein ComEC